MRFKKEESKEGKKIMVCIRIIIVEFVYSHWFIFMHFTSVFSTQYELVWEQTKTPNQFLRIYLKTIKLSYWYILGDNLV